jgi:hypothetical protein
MSKLSKKIIMQNENMMGDISKHGFSKSILNDYRGTGVDGPDTQQQNKDRMKQMMIGKKQTKAEIEKEKIVKKTSSPDHVYFNISITNTSTVELKRAEYNQALSVPFLENPSDYYCSIVRFCVPLQQIPIFQFLDATYSVTLSYNGVDYQTFLIYAPSSFISASDRAVYSYQQFLDSINNALQISFNALLAAVPAYNSGTTYSIGTLATSAGILYNSIANSNTGNTPSTSPLFWAPLVSPYMSYNSSTLLISLNAPTGFHSAGFTNINQPLKLWFNTLLWVFFSNFYKIYNGNTPTAANANGKNYNLIINTTGNNDIFIPAENGGMINDTPLDGFKMTQEFVSLYNWNTLRKIIFETSTIPIRFEQNPATIYRPWISTVTYTIGSIITYMGSGYLSLQTVNIGNIPNSAPTFWQLQNTQLVASSYKSILTDFEIGQDQGFEARSYAQYTPTSEYRLVDLIGTKPLDNIDLRISYQDIYLNTYPLYINPLNSADAKILFRKKTVKGSLSY